jgi:hypothetical protein
MMILILIKQLHLHQLSKFVAFNGRLMMTAGMTKLLRETLKEKIGTGKRSDD